MESGGICIAGPSSLPLLDAMDVKTVNNHSTSGDCNL